MTDKIKQIRKSKSSKLSTYEEALRRQQDRAEMIERYHQWKAKQQGGDQHGKNTRE